MREKEGTPHEESVDVWTNKKTSIPSDVLGSYTGTPKTDSPDGYEKPEQDADDL